jgi:hypothetical protein
MTDQTPKENAMTNDPDEAKDARRAAGIAAACEPSEEYEHLGRLADAGQQLAPSQLIALGMFRAQQKIAKSHGRTDAQ